MGIVRGAVFAGLGALGAFGIVSALRDGNDARLPEAGAAAARDAARRTLDSIDWDRDVLVISVPGTEWGLSHELVDGVHAQAGADRASVVGLAYPAAASQMTESVALGMATLELVLEEIRRRDPDGSRYHVALQGESQGAWIINDLLATQPFADTVDRINLLGLPSAATHDDAMRADARAHVTNHPLDPIAWPFLGPASVAAAAPGYLIGGNVGDAPAAFLQAVLNPVHALAFAGGAIVQHATGNLAANPHVYLEDYAEESPRRLLEGFEARES